MNELMHVMQEQIDVCDARTNDACDARMNFFFVHGWSLQSSS